MNNPTISVLPKSKIGRRYGWRPELPDKRDFSAPIVFVAVPPIVYPPRVDLRTTGNLPCVYDQGALGSCVGNSVAAAVAYDLAHQKRLVFTAPPSRLFIYWNARTYEGTTDQDSGCFIRDAFKGIRQFGACSEKDWDYVESRVLWPPTKPCYVDATGEQSLTYGRVDNTKREMMKLLLSNLWPIVCGFTVYPSFESEDVRRTGIVPMPGANESVLGGHSCLIVGYDDNHNWYIVRNSWGEQWGDHGYIYMPYGYLENPNLADDFWVVTEME